jgi:hypothetical protein
MLINMVYICGRAVRKPDVSSLSHKSEFVISLVEGLWPPAHTLTLTGERLFPCDEIGCTFAAMESGTQFL